MVHQFSSDWHEGFLKLLPAVQKRARSCFRRLTLDRRQEAIQETIAAACVNYQLSAAKGKLNVVHPNSLANFAVRQVRTGRHVGGSQDSARDVMSRVCQNRHGVRVSGYAETSSAGDWRQVVLADRKVPLPDLVAFRLDFSRWFQARCPRDQSIISALIAGERPSVIADRLGIARSRVSQLRCHYEREWRRFQGEAAR